MAEQEDKRISRKATAQEDLKRLTQSVEAKKALANSSPLKGMSVSGSWGHGVYVNPNPPRTGVGVHRPAYANPMTGPMGPPGRDGKDADPEAVKRLEAKLGALTDRLVDQDRMEKRVKLQPVLDFLARIEEGEDFDITEVRNAIDRLERIISE